MCLKTIYHNTYGDGSKDITERVDSCRPGYLCANPKIEELDREISCTKLQLKESKSKKERLANRMPTPYYSDQLPTTPRSMSPPTSRGSDTTDGSYHHRRRRSSFKQSYADESPYTPSSPMTIPTKLPRSASMPYGMETPPPTRGRRPIIVEEPAPRYSSDAIPIGADVYEHSSRAVPRRRDSYLSPTYRRSSISPRGYTSAEDEFASERRRRRRELRAEIGPKDVYGTSLPSRPTFSTAATYGDESRSSYSSSPASEPSPAVAAAAKNLRWADELRAEQNARIAGRPKLNRTTTGGGEPKGILKNGGHSRKTSMSDVEDELRRSVEGMGLGGATSSQRVVRDAQDDAYNERLRARLNKFSDTPREFTMGSGRRMSYYPPSTSRY